MARLFGRDELVGWYLGTRMSSPTTELPDDPEP
jgi:hypothetical protein